MMNNNKELLIEARTYTDKLIKGIESCVDKIRGNMLTEAYSQFSFITEGVDWLIGAMTILGKDLIEPINITEMNGSLKEMIQSIENQDNILWADLLEYEILERIVVWKEALEEVKSIEVH